MALVAWNPESSIRSIKEKKHINHYSPNPPRTLMTRTLNVGFKGLKGVGSMQRRVKEPKSLSALIEGSSTEESHTQLRQWDQSGYSYDYSGKTVILRILRRYHSYSYCTVISHIKRNRFPKHPVYSPYPMRAEESVLKEPA